MGNVFLEELAPEEETGEYQAIKHETESEEGTGEYQAIKYEKVVQEEGRCLSNARRLENWFTLAAARGVYTGAGDPAHMMGQGQIWAKLEFRPHPKAKLALSLLFASLWAP